MDKKTALKNLRNRKELYVVMSICTRLPYVICDSETYDDEILLFFTEEEAKRKVKSLLESKDPVYIGKIENEKFLEFYTGLYPIGVNCLLVCDENGETIRVQLDELIRRQEESEFPEGVVRVENPGLHLTAIYFMQKLRKGKAEEGRTEELKELNEEIMADFYRGKYIMAVQEKTGVVALKQKDGKVYQPVFTDYPEFQKFNREKKFRAIVVEAEKIPKILVAEASGVTINPLGVNLLLHVEKSVKTG